MPEVEPSDSCCLMTALLRIKTPHVPFPVWLGQSHPIKYLLSLVRATSMCCAFTRDYHYATNVCRRHIGRLRRGSDLECLHKVKPRTQMLSSASPLLDRDKTLGTAFAPSYLRVRGKMAPLAGPVLCTVLPSQPWGVPVITRSRQRTFDFTEYNIPPYNF
jgi:hypothetical protein